jgi:sortase A
MRLINLANTYIRGMSDWFLLFGAALIAIGASIQISRHFRIDAAERANQAPSFEQSVAPIERVAARAAAPVARATTPPPPDRIVIPVISLDGRVTDVGWEARVVNGEFAGNVWQTAAYAAGFHTSSARPGQRGNTVISGHNNIEGKIFKDLHQLKSGDRIFLYTADSVHEYRVEQNFIVPEAEASDAQRRENARWIGVTPDERLTLVTCYPPWSNTHRTIVVAHPLRSGTRSSTFEQASGVR